MPVIGPLSPTGNKPGLIFASLYSPAADESRNKLPGVILMILTRAFALTSSGRNREPLTLHADNSNIHPEGRMAFFSAPPPTTIQ